MAIERDHHPDPCGQTGIIAGAKGKAVETVRGWRAEAGCGKLFLKTDGHEFLELCPRSSVRLSVKVFARCANFSSNRSGTGVPPVSFFFYQFGTLILTGETPVPLRL